MKEIVSAYLHFEGQPLVKLDFPEMRIEEGLVYIDCYIDRGFFGEDQEKAFFHKKSYFDDKTYTIHAMESHSSTLIFNKVAIQSETYPSYKFIFLCYDYFTECLGAKNDEDFSKSGLKYLVVEGIDMQFTRTSENKRIRTMFGKDDSRMLSLELDNSEVYYEYYDKKRFYRLKIGLIKDQEKEKTLLIDFFQEDLIPYRVYKRIKPSLKYFISYLCGNNVVIREEYCLFENKHFVRTYSQRELTSYNVNHYLPIYDVHFKHKRLVNDYVATLSNYLIWDRILNLSEIIYLMNQSKQVNLESSFFILLIAIEKIANSLCNSGIIEKKRSMLVDDEKFLELKSKIFQLLEDELKGDVSKRQLEQLKSKAGNINNLNKTENKIDVLLDFCEIKRSDEVDQLFPKLRNLAIHQGEISYEGKDASKNYHTLFVLINTIICNLIQYKGTRFIEHKDGKNYISKKENYKFDIEKLLHVNLT